MVQDRRNSCPSAPHNRYPPLKPRFSTPSSDRALTSSFQETRFNPEASRLGSQPNSVLASRTLGAVPSNSERYDSDGGGLEGAGVAEEDGSPEAGFDMVRKVDCVLGLDAGYLMDAMERQE